MMKARVISFIDLFSKYLGNANDIHIFIRMFLIIRKAYSYLLKLFIDAFFFLNNKIDKKSNLDYKFLVTETKWYRL